MSGTPSAGTTPSSTSTSSGTTRRRSGQASHTQAFMGRHPTLNIFFWVEDCSIIFSFFFLVSPSPGRISPDPNPPGLITSTIQIRGGGGGGLAHFLRSFPCKPLTPLNGWFLAFTSPQHSPQLHSGGFGLKRHCWNNIPHTGLYGKVSNLKMGRPLLWNCQECLWKKNAREFLNSLFFGSSNPGWVPRVSKEAQFKPQEEEEEEKVFLSFPCKLPASFNG